MSKYVREPSEGSKPEKPKITKPPRNQTDRELLNNIVDLKKDLASAEEKLNSGEKLNPQEQKALQKTVDNLQKNLDNHMNTLVDRPNKDQLVKKLELLERPPTVRSVPDRGHSR